MNFVAAQILAANSSDSVSLDGILNQSDQDVCYVQGPNRFFRWFADSTVVANGTTVVIPAGQSALIPGRWFIQGPPGPRPILLNLPSALLPQGDTGEGQVLRTRLLKTATAGQPLDSTYAPILQSGGGTIFGTLSGQLLNPNLYYSAELDIVGAFTGADDGELIELLGEFNVDAAGWTALPVDDTFSMPLAGSVLFNGQLHYETQPRLGSDLGITGTEEFLEYRFTIRATTTAGEILSEVTAYARLTELRG